MAERDMRGGGIKRTRPGGVTGGSDYSDGPC